ncbi:MAG TPA: VPLPA-CTERM-specific exosortase XrtD [Nitrospira sp.]|nr:VPLPA-CTERM-specific exosortase XrtD [Nitrospira sp.]
MTSTLYLVFSIIVAACLVGYLYSDSLVFLLSHWTGSEDYGHGLFVPVISLFLLWQARGRMAEAGIQGSWSGLIVLVLGLLLYWMGELTTLYLLLHVSLWLVIVGLVISLVGPRAARVAAFPLLYLLTAIPLPVFVYARLASELQLVSSAMGVGFLQAVGVTAFRDGNLIDLGPVQLQVAEACSGIRYLLPLTSLALLCAYLYRDRMWKRVVLVCSSIPISILVNGFRIGVIGVLVETYGQAAAEGFLHLFEGWLLFMVSLALLVVEMWGLANIGQEPQGKSLLERFTWIDRSRHDLPAPRDRPSASTTVVPGPAYLFSVTLFVPFAFASSTIGAGVGIDPPRVTFVDFPMHLEGWQGTALPLEQQYIDALRFDDYLLADYQSAGRRPVSVYAAYYRSQRKGQAAHSPQSCLPGGGWEILSLDHVRVASASPRGRSFDANRAVIQKGDYRQVVFYWFKQRDRILADEYLVKLYLLWDALLRQRTDGALVRVASLVGPGESEAEVERRIVDFTSILEPELTRYVPD